MILHNIMEDKVIDITNDLMKGDKDFCCCERCKLDVVALALNNLQPKYVVNQRGELYGKVNMMCSQGDTDIVQAITRAIEIVRNNPRHAEGE